LSKSLSPLPEKFHGLTDTETRYRRRYVDLIANPEVRGVFETRFRIIAAIRRYMESQGYLEVETPMLQPIPGGATARPFETHHNALDMPLYLRIAPELYLKRLLVGGFERVYEINRSFRNEGMSPRHNPEFTMLEAYQAYGNMQSMMELTEGIITNAALDVLGTLDVEYQGVAISLQSPWRRATMAELTSEAAGVDISVHTPIDQLRGLCATHEIPAEAGWGPGVTTRRCGSTRTTSAPRSTACRPQADSESESTGWLCSSRTRRRFATSFCSPTCAPRPDLGYSQNLSAPRLDCVAPALLISCKSRWRHC